MYHAETRAVGAEKSRTINQAQALEYFEQFINATSLKNILGYFRTMCEILHLKPTYYPLFYPKLKAMLNSWKAKAIWKKLDSRSNHKCYGKAKIGEKTRVLIIGGGPCGLRSAIEAQLLGCKVVVVEKRDRLSRNNVLHLWPFVIEDLRALGAKKFFGKFCAGSIDHISIRQLQCILLKVALILGVEIHTEVSFENLIEPNHDEKIGWRAQLKPQNHPVSQYEFDVIIGADGKRNTLAGFKRKEFRGKLAIAITANFINKRTEAEARVEEISGVAFIFNQKFFKDLYQETGIDLENIVYYKDDTHYFVMTAKKPSLIEKGVILQDLADTERLLGADNVNREALLNYAKEAAEFSTNYQMPQLEFAVNHYGQPDVAMFDFTSMFAAENASKVLERSGYQLLMILVGDSLLEPFWPTGSGCARGFLSSLDAAWAIRSWSLAKASPLEVLAERESIYRLLAQTTPDNLNKDWKSYTLDPSTRYPNFNRSTVSPHQLVSLYDTDDIQNIEKMGRNLENTSNISRKRRRDMVDSEILIDWVKHQVKKHSDLEITDLTSIFRSGKVLCAIIHHYRPDLIDYSSLTNNEPSVNNQLAIDILEKDIGISPIMTGAEITETSDNLALAAYLTQVYDVFRTEIPHVKHPKLGIKRGISRNTSSSNTVLSVNSDRMSSCMLSSGSLLILYPFFPSTKPSECSLETVKRHEIKIKANNKIVSLLDDNKKLVDPETLEVESETAEANASNAINTQSGMIDLAGRPRDDPTKSNKNLLTNYSENYHLKLRSKLVKKQYLLRKHSTVTFQQKVEIQDININSSTTSFKDCLSNTSLWIKILEQNKNYNQRPVSMQTSRNTFTVIANTYSSNLTKKKEISDRYVKSKCRFSKKIQINFSSNANMCDAEENDSIGPEQVFSRVSYWIESNDFDEDDSQCTDILDSNTEPIETNIEEGFSDITSITKCLERKTMGRTKKLVITELSKNKNSSGDTRQDNLAMKFKSDSEMLKTLEKYSPYQVEEKPEYPAPFSVITEGQESELPESKYNTTSFKTITKEPSAMITSNINSRPSTKHKRHVEGILATKSANIERKTRKRKTLDKAGSVAAIQKRFEEESNSKSENRMSKRQQQRKLHAEHFLKSMQMLAANAKPDCPFEDYSIFVYRQTARNFEDRVKDLEKKFTYIPDYDNKPPSLARGNTDDDFVAKIKSIEQGWQGTHVAEKKPKDLLRKIGKIETSDWNIKEIEKKIKENKMGKPILRDKEKVPKWSREQFVARQTKMEKLDRQDSSEAKYADIDKNIKYLDMKLKEGTNRDLGQNKVATITEKLAKKIPEPADPVVPKSTDKPVVLPSYSGSEFCHFCSKRVYLMERLSAEGRFFHHGCFKCQYCKAQLRLGSYAFDKDGIYGHKFFCLHHYGMQGESRSTTKVNRRPSQKGAKPTAKKLLSGVSGVDLLDRVRTPERVEFSNLSRCSSDQEDSLSQMDEDEWTDRNFGASTAEVGSSDDDDSSSYSETDSDDEEAYEEAMEEPATKEGTMKWAERMTKRHYSKQYKSDSDPYGSTDSSSYYENSSDDDDSNTATEGEEEIRARELRLQEVRLEPPIIQADTGTDTEVTCNLECSEDLNLAFNEILNSNDLGLSKKSSSNSVNTADFDSALEDNLDINSNNIIMKNEIEQVLKQPVIDSGEESVTISKSDSNSNITVIEKENGAGNDSKHPIVLETTVKEGSFVSTDTVSKMNSLNNNEGVNKSINSSTVSSKTFFSDEFIPKFQCSEPEPLLIIKRTPSKINLPKEVGKPKVAVNTDIENARKYFGTPQKSSIRRSSTLKSTSKPKITKQSSLCEGEKKQSIKTENSFNFEPEDEDLKNIDDYIENLLKDEKELMKPIDPNKFKIVDQPKSSEVKSKSDSIDDLLEALEMETGEDVLDQSGIKKTDEKIDKLLKWLDEVDHNEEVTQSCNIINDSIGKYDNLEHLLKNDKHTAPVSKLAKNNIKYFDDLLSGKNVDTSRNESKKKSALVRSKTEINFNKPRSSVDLDAIKKVNIKKVMKKFESVDKDNEDSSSDKSNSNEETFDEGNKKPSLTRSKTEIHFKKSRTSVDLDAVSNVDIKRVLKKFESNDDNGVTHILKRRSNTFNAKTSSEDIGSINTQTELGITAEKNKMIRLENTKNDRITNPKIDISSEKINNSISLESKSNRYIKPPEEVNREKDIDITSIAPGAKISDDISNENYFNMQVRVNYEQYDVSEQSNINEQKLSIIDDMSLHNTEEHQTTELTFDNVDSFDKQNYSLKSEEFPTEFMNIQSLEINRISESEYEPQLESGKDFDKPLENNAQFKEMSEHCTIDKQNVIPNEKLNEVDNLINFSQNNEENQEDFNINNIECSNIKNLQSESTGHPLENDFKCVIGNLESHSNIDNNKKYFFNKFDDRETMHEDFEVNLNSHSQEQNINVKNSNSIFEMSKHKEISQDNELQKQHYNNLDEFDDNSNVCVELDSCPPPIPIRTKHSIIETPPQRPQRKRSLEQRNQESIERTRYVPRQEKLRNLEKLKKEIITNHSPKAHKLVVNNLNSNSDSKDKECLIQRISQNLGSGLVNNHVQAMVEEVISDDNSSDISSEVQNSATEISTDSEFAQDDPTPTSEIPAIILNDLYVNMSRGSSSNRPKKIQVTSGFIQKPNGKALKQDIELSLTPLVSPAPSLRKITPSIKPPTEAYALNRTQSTGGIATKVSLELKKRYLLGEPIGSGSIQKSGSASTLDTKLKSFCSNISDCQKLLKPASEISASMQTFCNKLDEHTSPILSPISDNKQLAIESKLNDEDVKIAVLPPPDLINVTLAEKIEETTKQTFENETEGRPRSPLHETSLIVPEIDWKKIGQSSESTSSSSLSSSSDEQVNTPNMSHNKIPTVEIHKPDDPPDDTKKLWDNHSLASDSVKSISSDKKQLNQPKTLPGLINDIPVGTMKKKSKECMYKKISPQDDKSSECSTPVSGGEEITAAFTETELSDWARDGGVSDDLEGIAFELNTENDIQPKIPELGILNHVCGRTDQEKPMSEEQYSANFDSIEFMDTCTESNSEDGIVDSIGYNLFKNEDIMEDSLNHSINNIVDEKICIDESRMKNSGYCVLASENNNFGGEVVNLKPSDIEQLKHNQSLTEREEDSLVVIETTTEENTCSDSTVKNITEIPVDANKIYETNIQKQRLEEKLIQLKKEKEESMLKAQIEKECDKGKDVLECYKIAETKNVEFEEHCQRLQSKVDFGNVKDSIDIRKSRRKSRDSPQKPDFIQEEKQYFGSNNSLKEITLNLTPTIKTPEQIYKKEVIEKERDVNQRLVQEMVMSKMRAENKPLERRVRNRPTNNLNKGFHLSKSATTDIAKANNISNLENKGANDVLNNTSCNFVLKEKEPIIELNTLQKSQTSPNIPEDNIRKIVCDLHIPVVPPRTRDLKFCNDKLRNDARVRAKMLSNEELGLSPEDKLQKFREKSKLHERNISKENSEFQLFPMSSSTQVITRKKNLQRPLSEYSPKICENRKSLSKVSNNSKQLKMCHSESNLLDMKNGKSKAKEVSPKKGIKFIKIMDLFSKKSPKGLFSKISAKSKDTSKEKSAINKNTRVKSFPETLSQINVTDVPPPVPPLPLFYTEQLLRDSEESSGDELKNDKHSACGAGDASGVFDDSLSSLTERHPHKRNRRSIREAQLKRHRMAQEIQRKLEETEVKTKELEEKGVFIEKNLRGELSQGSSKLESDLLQEWFDIMRDRTELRRYEKELIIRAQELELEDRHARLQHQLRKRLSEENKTEEDKETDCRIINEMLEIVSKRDSLTALLEEDRLRYLSEDRDFEEQMLAKDLYLTPNGKSMKNN